MPFAAYLCAALMAFGSWCGAAAAQDTAVAFAARLVGNETRTRLIVDFDREVSNDVYLLADPPRLLVDLGRTTFELDKDLPLPEGSVVKEMRYGAISDTGSRMVLDLSGPARVETATLRPLKNGGGTGRHRLLVDLLPSDAERFAKAVRVETRDTGVAQTPTGPARRFRVMLDAGHGGIDNGASGRGRLREKDVTLDFSVRLEAMLQKSDRIEVLHTRDGDSFMPLKKRLARIRDAHPDLLISIHADSMGRADIRGSTVYTLSERGSDALSRRLADKQNRADLVAGLALPTLEGNATDILIDLTRRETERFSINFADTLLGTLRGEVRLIGNPHRSANFFVLKAPDVPSVLLELGYLSNAQDEALLRDPEWMEKTAGLVAKSVLDFFEPRLAER